MDPRMYWPNLGSQINGALTIPFIAKTDLISAHARRSTSGITKFLSFVNDSRRNFSPIFTKFCILIAEVIFKAEFVFDRKRKYFARMCGSRISVFCAVYSISVKSSLTPLCIGRLASSANCEQPLTVWSSLSSRSQVVSKGLDRYVFDRT